MKYLYALCTAALFGSSPAWSTPPPPMPLTDEEVQSLIRIDQLSEWMGYPVDLATGLCVELNYPGSWPAAGLQGMSQRAENMLQQTLEACNTPAIDNRLVQSIRITAQANYSQQILRLRQPLGDMSQCRKVSGLQATAENCLVFAVGRPVSSTERKLLSSKEPPK